ncbi:MAG TPA: TrkA family potassium uptake protein [Longimicrobiales bacterium]|nr:TrkA family potassium uptake protein [Longimicrobiales bacterium]
MSQRKRKRFVVVGLGNFGSGVAESLHAKGHDVLAVDAAAEVVDRIGPLVSRAAVGDARKVDVLRRLGAEGSDAAIVSTGDDLAASVLATMALRDLGVRQIHVKVISRDHARIMEQLGVTETVFPERESALRLAERVASTEILNYIQLGRDFSLQELAVPDEWVGRSLRELELPRRYRISVLAVHDVLNDQISPVPDPDAPLKESDTILVAGRDADLQRVVEKH